MTTIGSISRSYHPDSPPLAGDAQPQVAAEAPQSTEIIIRDVLFDPLIQKIKFKEVVGKPKLFILSFEDSQIVGDRGAGSLIDRLNNNLGNIALPQFDNRIRKVILDFSNVESFSPGAVEMLLSVKTYFKGCRELRLCNIKPGVLSAFDNAGVRDKFEIFDSIEKALERF